jgi:hypothetical protein
MGCNIAPIDVICFSIRYSGSPPNWEVSKCDSPSATLRSPNIRNATMNDLPIPLQNVKREMIINRTLSSHSQKSFRGSAVQVIVSEREPSDSEARSRTSAPQTTSHHKHRRSNDQCFSGFHSGTPPKSFGLSTNPGIRQCGGGGEKRHRSPSTSHSADECLPLSVHTCINEWSRLFLSL